MNTGHSEKRVSNRTLVAGLAGAGLLMLGMSFAAVPLYKLFCQVTGYGGTVQRAERAPEAMLARRVDVRFSAFMDGGLPIDVLPLAPKVSVRLGQARTVIYRVTNTANEAIVITSVYNVAPAETGAYFNKLECFCFTEQHLAPGEQKDFAVTFFVDPALDDEAELDSVISLTLSYTFFEVTDPRLSDGAPDGAANG